ncbi:hypothetical protein [Mesorhizobium sp. M0243]|uniref:hypothetical protein n=1 Tax=Mesorhizobium sp. M0243 TaxID=2956925 RepID=UPI003334BFCE
MGYIVDFGRIFGAILHGLAGYRHMSDKAITGHKTTSTGAAIFRFYVAKNAVMIQPIGDDSST